MAAPKGWRLLSASEARERGLKPSSRPAVTPSGEVVPYVRYLNAQAKESGFKSHDDYRKFAASTEGKRYLKHFRREAKQKGTADKLELGSKGLGELRKIYFTPEGGLKPLVTTRAGGPLALFLEDLGIRERGATYDVGDTPET